MTITETMRQHDDVKWASRNVKEELKYCGVYMKDRRNITENDIRFYAWLFRAALRIINSKEQERKTTMLDDNEVEMTL